MDKKQQIIDELKSVNFPNLKLIYSEESLNYASDILKEQLDYEKEFFKNLLSKKNEELTFESFEDESFLGYYWSLLNHYENVNSNKQTRKIIEDFRPKLQDFYNKVSYNKKYYKKLLYVNENVDLNDEEKRIMYLRLKSYKDRGIDLEKGKQDELKKINKKLSKITNKFGDNITDDEKKFEYLITDFELIKNLPKEVLDIAKEAGKTKGGYLFDSDPTSKSAIMKYCSSEKIRRDFEKSSYTVASHGKYDNRKNVLKILELRNKKSKILGYKNYAELSLNDKMAESPDEVISLLKDIHNRAKTKAKDEISELKNYFKLKNLESFDFAYYSRIYKEKKYEIDEKKIKEFFEIENVISFLHNFIESFYGVEIKQLKTTSYEKEIKVYEIFKDKKLISYYFLDPFYRKGKRHGAWADNLRSKSIIEKGKIPIVLNVCNFQKALRGKTTLYLRDVETLFHEFGHAIHEMLSESKYDELSGFGVEWDFVEVPSQLLENWVKEVESLQKFAKHYKSGEVMPQDMIKKIDEANSYMSGNFWIRQNEFALLDMNIYSVKPPKNVKELDKKMLSLVNSYSIFKRKDDYKMYCSFSHIFDGGYSAGYYSYLWAEIIEADIFSEIKKLGMFSKKTGDKLYKTIIGQGTRKKAKDLFYDFMGRELNNMAFFNRYKM